MNTVTAMTTAADFFCRLLVGRNVLTKRREIEVEVRYSYRRPLARRAHLGTEQGVRAADQSPLVLGDAAAPLPNAKGRDAASETSG